MKKWPRALRLCLAVILIFPLGYVAWGVAEVVSEMPRDEFMSLETARKLWGESPFDADKFKNGDEAARASMAVSILKNPKPFIGKTVPELRQILGPQTGFYRFDMNPAYIISESDKADGDTWQILFLIDRHYKIKSVKIHKN